MVGKDGWSTPEERSAFIQADRAHLEAQIQRSDDLAAALSGVIFEHYETPLDFKRRIDVVKYDDQGYRNVIGSAVVDCDGNVTVIKAEVDSEKLRVVLQTQLNQFSISAPTEGKDHFQRFYASENAQTNQLSEELVEKMYGKRDLDRRLKRIGVDPEEFWKN